MRDSHGKASRTWRRLCGAGTLSGALLLALPASAQDSGGSALRFLKPWIERQLFGHETSTTPPAAPAESPPAAEPDAAPADGEAAPDDVSPDESPAGDDAASTPAPDDPIGAELRGLSPSDATADPDAEPDAPPIDDATAVPEAASPGVPVEKKPEPLRFAVLSGRSPAATMATIGPVAEALQAALGRPVEILPFASYVAMIDAQVQRRIDGGFFSAAAFAAADSGCACLEPLVAPKASDGTLAYHAVIVARAGSGIASVADLAGKTVAVGASDSLGSRRLQLAGLMSEGIDPATAFGAVTEVESADAAVRLVASGAADAAFAWSSLSGSVESGYSSGTLTGLVASGEIAMGSIAVVWSSPPIVHGPFAVLRTLDAAERKAIEDYLVALSAGNPDAYDLLDPFYGGGYAPVDPQDYAGLATLMAENVDSLRLPAGPATTGATSVAPAPETPPTPE